MAVSPRGRAGDTQSLYVFYSSSLVSHIQRTKAHATHTDARTPFSLLHTYTHTRHHILCHLSLDPSHLLGRHASPSRLQSRVDFQSTPLKLTDPRLPTLVNKQIKCDRLQPVCSSCVKYKATCVRTAFPAGAPLSTVSVEAIGAPGLRVTTSAKRDRFHTETEILDSCLRDVQTLQINRLRKIELFFDRLGIDETRLDEISWFTEQLKSQRESIDASNGISYGNEEVCSMG